MGDGGASSFASARVAAGYAADRPAVHPRVLALASDLGLLADRVGLVLDLGCGAGASTRAVLAHAERCVGVDPSVAMVLALAEVAPAAFGVVGAAEALPLGAGCVDLVTAAGALDYADLGPSLHEVGRVLRRGGRLLVYDFGTGERLAAGPDLAPWFAEFRARHPRAPRRHELFSIERASAAAPGAGLAVAGHHPFEVQVPIGRDRFIAYLATESNVTAAVDGGADLRAIRAWMAETLPWPGDEVADVVFAGYLTAIDRV